MAGSGAAPLPGSIEIGSRRMSLSQFLRYCGSSLSGRDRPAARTGHDELRRARDRFVRAGLAGLALPDRSRWLQIGLGQPATGQPRQELFGRIAQLARGLLRDASVDNFFFMHKPPGLRLRFELAAGHPDDLPEAICRRVERWRRDRLLGQLEPGVYEPESRLFGGEPSMPYVHTLFTVDSLAWLDFHAGPAAGGAGAGPAWLVSLSMLRALFDGLDITGWEDLDVWHRLRERAGRRLAGPGTELAGLPELAGAVRAAWRRPDRLTGQLPPRVGAILADHHAALRPAVAQWRSGYFCTHTAAIGPRSAAASYVIFHWNRAGLPPVRQALLAEALADREGRAAP